MGLGDNGESGSDAIITGELRRKERGEPRKREEKERKERERESKE
jgi:hypothetical protein